ncbi:MAG TPA: hypothetical protein VFB52_00175 [Solirubrobacterales bacterium]|nr:hypothetical protein [Solirubrobacterales bacterium]
MPAATAAPSPIEGCTWKRHSKQVVKRVRRHGKQQRVKRLKHWWTCQAQPSTFATLTLSPGSYRLYCSLYKHEAKGMEATLAVSAS